ncbi:dihydropyrimidinase [Nitriliruptoraceae bacterium ZYF776]|nr:dihydropyrimidinase [Profundirhabdus halotolerans]
MSVTDTTPQGGARRILIRGGEVVSAIDVRRADVLVVGQRIAAVGDGRDWAADHVVDATDRYVLPGGVDAHTHIEYPIDGFTTRTADDFTSGTIAAAHGGTTTVIDFVKKEPDRSILDSHRRRAALVARKAVIDVGLHTIVPPREQQADALDDLEVLAREGVSSWKFFMAYPGTQMVDDGLLLRGFELARDHGVLPMVHAENGHMVQHETDRLLRAGHHAEHHHHDAHHHGSEAEAVHRAIVLAESVDSPLFIVHVSSAQAVEEIAAARARGVRVWAETCPQYLVAAYEDYADLGERAAAYLCSPPIRERANQDRLWNGLAAGVLSTVGTDHAAFRLDQPEDLPPQKGRSPGYFPKVPNGVPGVEDRLMVLWQTGVVEGRLDLPRFVEVTATRPAKLFGLHPRKGTVAPGADADLVVWDPSADHRLGVATSHQASDYHLYEGMRVTGVPELVLSRGEVVVDHGELDAAPGRGRYLGRGAPDLT